MGVALVVLLGLACAVVGSAGSAFGPQALVWCDALSAPLEDLREGVSDTAHCVAVDICTQKDHRGGDIAMQHWTQVGAIGAVRVPRGVVLGLCEPDFAALRTSGVHVCNANTVEHVYGDCVGAAGSSCHYAPPGIERMEMLRYGFQATWGCHVLAEPGFELSAPTFPNQLLPCAAVPNARYTEHCAFECLPAYANVDGVCVHQCAAGPLFRQTTCAANEYAANTCHANDDSVWFTCEPCSIAGGVGIADFSARVDKFSDTCGSTPCAPGQYGVGGRCMPCAKHTHTSTAGQTVCTPCEWGWHSPGEGGVSCAECFASPLHDQTEPECPAGQQRHARLQEIEAYFELTAGTMLPSLSVPMMHEFCLQGFACLPCRPGQYELDGVCVSCAIGTYQPHFGASVCFECSAGQSTASAGSSSSIECICEPGFE